jgi:hypothetical protein
LRVDWDIASGAQECRLCAHLFDIHRRYPVYREAHELNSDQPRLKAICFPSDEDSDDDDDDSESDSHSSDEPTRATLIRYFYVDGLVDAAYLQALIFVHSG